MSIAHPQFNSIDEYIAAAPPEVQEHLQAIRTIIKEEAPEATELIRYDMPTFKLKRTLVHFAAFKNHISLFPATASMEKDIPELAPHLAGQGTIQFKLNQPIPLPLIRKIVAHRVQEEQQETADSGY